MKKGIVILVVLLLIGFGSHAQELKWYSFEEAVALSRENPKKILIDIYTDWCGWCKKMDAEAYSNQQLIQYISENYYPVKFNAEQREDVEFNEHTFKFVASGRRGVHELAVALTNNQLSYPTTVFMDEEFRIIQPIPGYMKVKDLQPILAYFGENAYTDTSWDEFRKEYKAPGPLVSAN